MIKLNEEDFNYLKNNNINLLSPVESSQEQESNIFKTQQEINKPENLNNKKLTPEEILKLKAENLNTEALFLQDNSQDNKNILLKIVYFLIISKFY